MVEFQRARRPEQVRARHEAILDTARTMLAERAVAEISLRELACRVGLAKSNVLRYFDSRETIFLEVMDGTWRAWLDQVEGELDRVAASDSGRYASEIRVASAVAASLSAQRLLCELISVTAGVLEKNITLGFARTFKARAAANTTRLASLVRARLPQLSEAAAEHFARATFVAVAGMWPLATPTEAVATVMAELGAPPAGALFVDGLRECLINQLVGLSARAAA